MLIRQVAQFMGVEHAEVHRPAHHEMHLLECMGTPRRMEMGHRGAIPLGVGSRCHTLARDDAKLSGTVDLDLARLG